MPRKGCTREAPNRRHQPWDYNRQGGVKGAMFTQHWYREADGTVVNLPWEPGSLSLQSFRWFRILCFVALMGAVDSLIGYAAPQSGINTLIGIGVGLVIAIICAFANHKALTRFGRLGPSAQSASSPLTPTPPPIRPN
jgi:hypothetical protein